MRTVRNLFGKDLKACFIRADNAKEFTGGEFSVIMEREKIDSSFSNPHTPPRNDTAERFNRTLLEKIRSLMFDSGLPKYMWNSALEVAVNLYNRTPNSPIEFQTPLNVIFPNSKCHFDKIRRFGSIAYAKKPITETKLSEKAIKGILVGQTSNGYILWHSESGKLIHSKHVKIREKLSYKNIDKTLGFDIVLDENLDSEDLREDAISLFEEDSLERETENPKEIEVVRENSNVKNQDKKRKRNNLVDKNTVETQVRKQPKRNAKKRL